MTVTLLATSFKNTLVLIEIAALVWAGQSRFHAENGVISCNFE